MPDQPSAELFKLQRALAGRYSLERELGRGGMGIVYLAREVSLDRPVALKLLPPGLAAHEASRERFLNEARMAAKLSHPNIVPIFTVDEVEEFVFFAMAYIEGETLGQRIRARGPRPSSEVARVLREVAWALGYAHAQGVIHRDVKPDNILLEEGSGRALVADFGIASVAADGDPTRAGQVAGTVEFVSPEQAKGGAVGAASDMYSLGVVGYYALSGRFPFEGSTPSVILAKHLSETPSPLASIAPGVSSRLARAIDRCLAKDPAQRFADDEELADALGQALPQRRELPLALRVFVKRRGRMGTGGALLYLGGLALLWGMALFLAPFPLGALAGMSVFIAGVTVIPAGTIIRRVRRLLRSGFARDELVIALRAETERAREEGAFEFGHGPSLYDKVVRVIVASAMSVIVLLFLAIVLIPWPYGGPNILVADFGFSIATGLGCGLLALARLQRRRDINGALRGWFWRSVLGRWVFRIAGIGLKRAVDPASATFRPTEFAIGMAADKLFEELPRALRRQLGELPEVVRMLETDAQRMRDRVEELKGILAEVGSERPESRSLEAALPIGATRLVERRRLLREDLLAARDASQQRLADAVAALETIRLGLLRMQAGSGSVESLTGDLAAARDVAEEIERLLAAQEEVETLLQSE